MAPCTCGTCGRPFSGVEAFDRHRHHRGEHGGCLDPVTVDGLEYRDGMWRGPEASPQEKAKIAARRQRQGRGTS